MCEREFASCRVAAFTFGFFVFLQFYGTIKLKLMYFHNFG